MYLTQGLHRSLQRHPGKTALLHLADGAERRCSFAELLATVSRQAAALAAQGVRVQHATAQALQRAFDMQPLLMTGEGYAAYARAQFERDGKMLAEIGFKPE